MRNHDPLRADANADHAVGVANVGVLGHDRRDRDEERIGQRGDPVASDAAIGQVGGIEVAHEFVLGDGAHADAVFGRAALGGQGDEDQER